MLHTPPAPPPRIGVNPTLARARVVVKVSGTPAAPVKGTSFFHSGDAGDIIYSLPFIKAAGGGTLFIGPDPKWNTNSNRDRQRYSWILPLLKCQPYLTSAEYVHGKPDRVTYDLNLFREIWMTNSAQRQEIGLTRLFEAYPKRFGMEPLSETEPWLEVDPEVIHDRPVVIHRSARYRNSAFPWKEVASRYAHQMLFVGLRSEFEEWVGSFGRVAEYAPTENALQIANLIAGAKLFIGNQSSPNAIALGLGKTLVQEVCPLTPDCVFRRTNTQYFFRNPIAWPSTGRMYVIPAANANGLFEIGPCCQATGLGDYLTITPLMRELKGRCIMKMPESDAGVAELFSGLCQVELTKDYPVFRHQGNVHSAKAKLDLFGINASPMPKVILAPKELKWAQAELAKYKRPLCFVPSCSKHWAHVRQRPPEFWEKILPRITGRDILQFGREDYPLVKGAVRMPFYSLRQLAAVYASAGEYLGVDTGDAHLMLAVGGFAVTVHPDACTGYNPREWHYDDARARYVNFNNPTTIHGLFNGR